MAIKMYDGTDKSFLEACQLADVKPTRRQHKKFINKKGKAYRAMLDKRESERYSVVRQA